MLLTKLLNLWVLTVLTWLCGEYSFGEFFKYFSSFIWHSVLVFYMEIVTIASCVLMNCVLHAGISSTSSLQKEQ